MLYPMATITLPVRQVSPRPRRVVWRSPADQPRHARPALLVITALGAVLWFWDIGGSQYHPFYAETARSMSGSWKAFLYGSFDPGSSITIDKLPGFLWPQAISARIFGFHPWSLTLPQALEGVASVPVLFRVVRGWAGANAGLLAALAYTVTPVTAGLYRTASEDPAFTLLVLLAADAALRATRDGRLRPLVLSGVWVGLSFQAKMLEAWVVLPALGLAYLVAAPTSLRRRLVHLLVAAAVTVAVSASWILLVTVTPARDRPYVDGTTDNSAYSQVVGYNFLNRFSSVGLDASSTGSVTSVRGGSTPPGHRSTGIGTSRPENSATGERDSSRPLSKLKMFGPQLAPQTGWLYPTAALSLVLALVWRRGRPRTDLKRAGYLLWGVWLALYFLAFSMGSIGGHTYYMGVIAAPLASLTGAGTAMMWRAHRDGGRRAWALPGAIAATAAWGAFVNLLFPSFRPWVTPTAALLALAALGLLFRARGGATATRRLALAGLLAGVAAMLLPPAAWSAGVLETRYGHSGMGTVGPSASHRSATTTRSRTPRTASGKARSESHQDAVRKSGRSAAPSRGSAPGILTPAQQRLLAYTEANRSGARFLFATTNWPAASPYILAKDAPVLPMGGFTGLVPSPSMTGFRQLVASGQLRYVLVSGATSAFGHSTSKSAPPAEIASWTESHCTAVPVADYGGSGGQHLYRCTASS